MRNIALILAGGKGGRMLMPIPKQFVEVAGESVLTHTLRPFQKHSLINAIYVVCAKEWQGFIEEECRKNSITKIAGYFPAGETAFQSINNGIKGIVERETEDCIVLTHDGVRPLVSQQIISNNIAVCLTHGNAITAIPSQEGLMVVDAENKSKSEGWIGRETVLRAQTPHTFHLSELTQMLKEAKDADISESQSLFTLANQLKHTPLYAAEGEMTNFKLTMKSDLDLYQTILRGRN